MPLMDFDSRFPNRDLATHAIKCPSSSGERTPPAAGLVLGGPAAVARVDHGRWVADCPFGCGGAEMVSLAGTPFFCCECRNAASGHVPIPVVLPSPKAVAQADAYLSARTAPANRNWRPERQTIADLRDENREHGIRLSKEDA